MGRMKYRKQWTSLHHGNELVEVCNSLALTARRLAFDECHKSPFEQKAREHGINAPGGKPDDIAIVLILVG